VTVLHVVEKGDGAPDKTPVEQSERLADEAFAIVRERLPDATGEVRYGTDVVETILDAAEEVDATATAFRPREGGTIARLLTGDLSARLIREAARPVIALPEPREGGDTAEYDPDRDHDYDAADTDGGEET
jgi:nucleotide-binding universal stress UspA family protein